MALKTYDELTIQDNFLFQKVMRNVRLCKYLIEIILDIKIRKITYPANEKVMDTRYDSKGVRLDVYVEDDKGTIYDIEMQTTDGRTSDELPKRTRYYQAQMDMDMLEKGERYHKLRKTYIIFICTFDPFKDNLSRYTFKETCQEKKDLLLGDETTKMFLNSKGKREGLNKDIASFLDYVDGKAAEGKFTQDVDAEVTSVKAHKETRVEYMTWYDEMLRQHEEGVEEGRFKTALNMLKKKLPLALIAECSELTLEQVKKIAKDNNIVIS